MGIGVNADLLLLSLLLPLSGMALRALLASSEVHEQRVVGKWGHMARVLRHLPSYCLHPLLHSLLQYASHRSHAIPVVHPDDAVGFPSMRPTGGSLYREPPYSCRSYMSAQDGCSAKDSAPPS